MKLIDTHAHLDFPEFDKDRAEVIEKAKKEGVGIINSCLSPEGFETVRPFKALFLTVGCCPFRFEDYEPQYGLLQRTMDDIIGIGEIGLDHYWIKDAEGRKKEEIQLIKLLNLAKEHDKPVVIHSRNAERRALEILEQENIEKAIMHCFSGELKDAEHAIDIGYLVSIPTNITNSKQKQKFAIRLPLESIVLETDAPYLSPVPGTRNEPKNVVKSAQKIAELRGVEFEEVAKITTRNARNFFGI